MDGRETVGIAWGELRWEGTDGSHDWVDGEETVGKRSGGKERYRSVEGITEGKPWGIAGGELRWEGAMRE